MENRVEKAHWKVGIRQRFIDHLPLATHNQLTYKSLKFKLQKIN